jgi:hypothetical protein
VARRLLDIVLPVSRPRRSPLTSVARALLPWETAALLFRPRRRLAPEDPVIRRLGQIRAVGGLALIAFIALWFGSYSELGLENYLEGLALTSVLAIPSALLLMALLVRLTEPTRRRAALRQMRWPTLSVGAFALVMTALLLFNAGGAAYVGNWLTARGIRIPLDGLVYGGIFGLWLLVFCFRSAYLVTRHWFNAVDGHPLLEPLMANWMAWLGVVVTVLTQETGEGAVPPVIAIGMPVGAALVTTALAVAETWQLARRYGISLRGGPWPAGTVPS